MAKTILNPLSENDLAFMKIWQEKILANKNNINLSDLDTAAELIKHRRTGTCSSCNRNDVIDINNKYNQMLNQYNGYLSDVKKKEDEVQNAKNELKKKEICEPEESIGILNQKNILKTKKNQGQKLLYDGDYSRWLENENKDEIEDGLLGTNTDKS
jgi:hypothetical protein